MTAHASLAREAVTLFAEDFDAPALEAAIESLASQPPAGPLDTIEAPPLSPEAAYASGFEAGAAEARAAQQQDLQCALDSIAPALASLHGEAARQAESCAEAVARLLLGCLRAAMPEYCRRFGTGEALAVLAALRPAIRANPQATLRANPATLAGLAGFPALLPSGDAPALRLVTAETMAPGDIVITWNHGGASRDTAAIWQQIEAALALALPSGGAQTDEEQTHAG